MPKRRQTVLQKEQASGYVQPREASLVDERATDAGQEPRPEGIHNRESYYVTASAFSRTVDPFAAVNPHPPRGSPWPGGLPVPVLSVRDAAPASGSRNSRSALTIPREHVDGALHGMPTYPLVYRTLSSEPLQSLHATDARNLIVAVGRPCNALKRFLADERDENALLLQQQYLLQQYHHHRQQLHHHYHEQHLRQQWRFPPFQEPLYINPIVDEFVLRPPRAHHLIWSLANGHSQFRPLRDFSIAVSVLCCKRFWQSSDDYFLKLDCPRAFSTGQPVAESVAANVHHSPRGLSSPCSSSRSSSAPPLRDRKRSRQASRESRNDTGDFSSLDARLGPVSAPPLTGPLARFANFSATLQMPLQNPQVQSSPAALVQAPEGPEVSQRQRLRKRSNESLAQERISEASQASLSTQDCSRPSESESVPVVPANRSASADRSFSVPAYETVASGTAFVMIDSETAKSGADRRATPRTPFSSEDPLKWHQVTGDHFRTTDPS
eukprot:ANDGO_01661.mRNA.1 hypothetical protein